MKLINVLLDTEFIEHLIVVWNIWIFVGTLFQVVYSTSGKVGEQKEEKPKPVEDEEDDFDIDAI